MKADPVAREEYRRKDRERNRPTWHRGRKYGLTPEQVDTLIEGVGGKCEICKTVPEKGLVIDHCHSTGKVRGMLCQQCNSVLGMAKDDINVLTEAIRYLERQ